VSPTFCRHNRFIQRCPICRETVPGYAPSRPTGARGVGGTLASTGAPARARPRAAGVRVRHERRFLDDGYRCELVPGLRSSQDARRLVDEIGFAAGRLLALAQAPPGVYAEARDCGDIEQATWMCFVTAYLSPLQGAQPFAGIHRALVCDWASGDVPDLQDVPPGPRSSHDPSRGAQTLLAYRRFAEHAGSQQRALAGEPEWTPKRRFERAFERLALPGFGRLGRYDLLVTLGWLGLYELRADSLHLSAQPGARSVGASGPSAGEEATLAAAKRVFGIGDPIHIERRAAVLAAAAATPVEALDLALWNWSLPSAQERSTLGFPPNTLDAHALKRAQAALEL
jgi:hypothetical protein